MNLVKGRPVARALPVKVPVFNLVVLSLWTAFRRLLRCASNDVLEMSHSSSTWINKALVRVCFIHTHWHDAQGLVNLKRFDKQIPNA